MKPFAISLLLPVLLVGCSRTEPTPSPASPTRTPVPTATSPSAHGASETRMDDQGAVVFEVTPLNLDQPGATLDFQVSMNTHSVDTGWDLARQAVLHTDTGVTARPSRWPVGGGHHYSAILSFPAFDGDGRSLLDGAGTLTLIVRDTDVPERTFVWELGP